MSRVHIYISIDEKFEINCNCQLKCGHCVLRSSHKMCLCLCHNIVAGDYKSTFISDDCGVICNLDALL